MKQITSQDIMMLGLSAAFMQGFISFFVDVTDTDS